MSLKDDISDEFQIDYGTKLGSGAFGEVFRGIWKKKNNSFVAVKRIKEIHSNAKKMMEE
jgi:serine/threonine protein kinase